MNRSAGVTVVAVLAMIGSAFTAFLGVFLILDIFLLRAVRQDLPQGRVSLPEMNVVLVVSGVFFFALAAWGVATAMGLLRLRPWARISTLVFSGLLVFFSLFPVLVFLVMPLPTPPNTTASMITMVRLCIELFYLFQIAVGVWWLVYFTRPGVKAQFTGGAVVTAHRASPRPLSITVVAWALLVTGIMTLLYIPFFAPLRFPVVMLGTFLKGQAALFLFFVYAAVEVAAGLGLLKLKPWSHTLAVGFFGFGLLNGLFFFVLPDKSQFISRVIEAMPGESRASASSVMSMMSGFFWMGALFGVLVMGIALWFLLTRKKAFLAASSSAAAGPTGL